MPEPPREARQPLSPEAERDHELIRAAQAGVEEAFAELVRRHQASALRLARNMVPGLEDARDLVQEAYLRVFKNLARFDFQHDFKTWLFRIVTNLSIDHLRRRRPTFSTSAHGGDADEEAVELELPDPDAEAPERRLDKRETARKVRDCIAALAPHFQSVLVLRELEGLPCTEIAEIVGATHVTVRWRLHRGRKLFQEEWERRERLAPGLRPAARVGEEEAHDDGDAGANMGGGLPVDSNRKEAR
jgi:RNA polymerase sigma-70 factor (ECF subfamily)